MVACKQVRGIAANPKLLRDCLAQAQNAPSVARYMTNMWRQVIEDAAAPASTVLWDDRWGELPLPYVPVQPENYGVELTSSSAVLDIGSLSGYGMYDFCRRRLESGLPVPRIAGLDNDVAACQTGRRLSDLWASDVPEIRFVAADCQALPFAPASFDLLIARCVLPYVDFATGLAQIRRVLRPGGLAVVQVHAPGYYLAQVATTLNAPRRIAYYLRPLLSSAFLTCSGRQPRSPHFRETALTPHRLRDLAKRADLLPVYQRPTRYRPLTVFRAG